MRVFRFICFISFFIPPLQHNKAPFIVIIMSDKRGFYSVFRSSGRKISLPYPYQSVHPL